MPKVEDWDDDVDREDYERIVGKEKERRGNPAQHKEKMNRLSNKRIGKSCRRTDRNNIKE
jgi:hypothetical protein